MNLAEQESPQALFNRAAALEAQQRYAEAMELYTVVLALVPGQPETHFSLANCLQHLGRFEESLPHYDAAIRAKPAAALFHCNKGVALKSLGRIEEAEHCYRHTLGLMPGFAAAHNNLGLVLREKGRAAEALTHYDTALALEPAYAEAHNNKGIVLELLHRYDDALACYNQALALNPRYVEALNNKGFTLQELKRYDEALACYDQAMAIAPHHIAAHFNKGTVLLLRGEWKEGFELFEWRWKRPDLKVQPLSSPRWQGESLQGKTIILQAEQGLGDSIQFCRYVPLLQEKGARVILSVPPVLAPLMQSLEGKPEILTHGGIVPSHDYHCPLMSLPHRLGTTRASVPALVPYLAVDAKTQERWREKLGEIGGRRVGLVWSGNATHKNNHNRSIALEAFAPLFAQKEHLSLHALQKDIEPRERELLAAAGVKLHADDLHDFTDTAALVNEMDLVVTVDTSVAHLAGALAKPVWILLPFAPDYRWMAEGDESPWYPTARLFRQPAPGDWESVIRNVVASL